MKKVFSLLLAVVLLSSLYACGGGSNFTIEGKWKNTGDYTFGQVSFGAIVVFDGTHCNVVSPQDTYAIYANGDNYQLDCTTLMGDTLSFTVKPVDNDNIYIYYNSNYLEMTRVG